MAMFLRRIIWFICLMLVQVWICNYIHIWGMGTPLIYLYFIFKLDSECGRKELLLWSFAIGLCIDMFCNTPGMNAAATTMLGLCRPQLLRMQLQRDTDDSFEPGIRMMGFSPFLRYILTGVLLHTLFLNLLDSFTLFRIKYMLLNILAGTTMTVFCIMCLDTLRREK